MEIHYRKIAWFLQVTPETTLKKILGKSRYKDIVHGFERLQSQPDYQWEIQNLSMSALDEFAALYQKEVATKFNPQIHDLYAKYAHQIGDTSLYFTSIRHQGKLIAGHTFKYNPSMRGKKTLSGEIKMAEDTILGNASLFLYLEYLFFEFGLQQGVEQFCAGKDRNCYGLLGESLGLALHKLQNHFIPYLSKDETMYTINPDTLTQDILVFLSDDITQPCSAHIWLKHPEHQKELCSLLEKRNITTTIYPL